MKKDTITALAILKRKSDENPHLWKLPTMHVQDLLKHYALENNLPDSEVPGIWAQWIKSHIPTCRCSLYELARLFVIIDMGYCTEEEGVLLLQPFNQ